MKKIMIETPTNQFPFFQNKNVLVTGAAGFIGSHLCETLLQSGARVVGVDNFLSGQKRNVELLSHSQEFKFIHANAIESPETYLPQDFIPDVVLHFASPASPPRYQAHPVETYLVNSLGTHQLLQHIVDVNPKARMVFASTSEVYGDPLQHPQTETYWGNVNPNGPRSCYDEAKRLGETICGVHAREFKTDVRIVRIFNTYGPRMDLQDGRIIPNLIHQALSGQDFTIYGDGKQTRSYCYVTDLVRGILQMTMQENLAGETVNLGNPEEMTILETAQIVGRVVGNLSKHDTHSKMIFSPLPQDDPTKRKPDISKAQKLLGWMPTVNFEDGLRQTVTYFQTLS
jgi:nucleoside-diphosphate-sugar epimerase